MRAGMIDLESNTTLVQAFPAHEAVPDGSGPFPTILVFHDRFGLTAQLRGVVNRLARAGFCAVAPNFYALPSSFASVAPEFMGTLTVGCFGPEEDAEADERAATLTDERAEAVFRQAARFLDTRARVHAGGLGALGFGMGGRLAFLAACAMPQAISACVAFYPEGLGSERPLFHGQADPLGRAESLTAAVRLFYGGLDDSIHEAQRERVRARLTQLGKDFHIEAFPEAGHDFFCSDRESYRIKASKTAWEEALAFFRATLGAA